MQDKLQLVAQLVALCVINNEQEDCEYLDLFQYIDKDYFDITSELLKINKTHFDAKKIDHEFEMTTEHYSTYRHYVELLDDVTAVTDCLIDEDDIKQILEYFPRELVDIQMKIAKKAMSWLSEGGIPPDTLYLG